MRKPSLKLRRNPESGDTCSSDYEGQCLDPPVVDYDCEGNEGNGPGYVTGSVTVVAIMTSSTLTEMAIASAATPPKRP